MKFLLIHRLNIYFPFKGYIRHQINELMVLCTPLFPHDSMLECSKNLRFCHGRNIMINFTDLIEEKQPFRYKMDVLKKGQIGEKDGFTHKEDFSIKNMIESCRQTTL